MSIPPSVKALADRADALMANLSGAQPGVTPPAPAPAPANAPAPAVEAPAPAPKTDSTPTPPASAPAPSDTEHRYKVLQGKYNAEVPRLTAENARLAEQNADLESRLAALEAALAAAPKPDTSLVRPDEVQEYGEGMVDMVRRAAKEQVQALESQVAELKAQLGQVQSGVAQTQQLGFFETLTRDHPDWAVVNEDETFHKWLSEIDPLSGEQRQALLANAQKAKKGERASAIFTEFKRTRDSWVSRSNQLLSEQEAPAAGAANNGQVQDLSAGRIYTRAEVNDFYAKVRSGQIRMGSKEQIDTEAEIQRALAQGRIR